MNINFVAVLLLGIICISCNPSKHVSTVKNNNTLSVRDKKIIEEQESKLFFEAEQQRLISKTDEAIKTYSNFVTKYPNNATALFNLARLEFNQNEFTTATKHAAKAVDISPENKAFREFYAQVLTYNNKTKLAEQQYDILLNQSPKNAEYLYKKVLLFLKGGNYNDAILILSELEGILGFNDDIIIQKKNIYLNQNRIDEAEKEMQKLELAFPESPQYTIMHIDMLDTNKNSQKIDSLYKTLENNFPNDPVAQVALAQYYLDSKNKLKYKECMQHVMKNKNLNAETKLALLMPSLRNVENDSMMNKNDIILLSKSVIDETPNNKDAISLYANILYYSKNYVEASKSFQKIVEIDSSNMETWNQLMAIYFELKAYDSVISVSKRCSQYFPKENMPYFYKGIAYAQMLKTDSAVVNYEKALQLTVYNKELKSQILSNLGDAYNTLKLYELSDSSFNLALKLIPNDPTVLNNYAYYLSLRKEKLNEALKMSKKSLELQPNSKSFLDTYGWILYVQSNYKEALIYIQKAIDADGENDGTLYEHLGDVYFKLNNTQEAINAWKKAKEKGETNQELLKKIENGQISE